MTDCGCGGAAVDTAEQRRVLWIALGLNFGMFGVEVAAGFLAGSVSLLADGLDMLTDAATYGIALLAIGRTVRFKANAAVLSGTFVLLLGVGVLADAGRRAVYGGSPEGVWMIAVAAAALAVNAFVLQMLSRQRDPEVHMRAAYICTRADVVANAAVIASGIAVSVTGWRFADLIVGAGIGSYVIREALDIFSEARDSRATDVTEL
jgi:cation diffusion facilitator family transporter